MELRQIRYFVSIIDAGSLSRAAQKLYVAQSALSKQLADLEDELGAELVHRSHSGVVATEAGRIFYEHAQAILKQIGDAKVSVRYPIDSPCGTVVTAIPQSVATTLALPLLRAAAVRFPNIVLHLNEELTGNLVDQLMRGRTDVAVFTEGAVSQDDFLFTPMVEEDFYLIHAANDAHAPPRGDVGLEQALARPLVFPSQAHSQSTRSIVEAALQGTGFVMQATAAEVNSVHILKSAVEAGIGPTIMPLGLAQREVDDGRLVAHRIAFDGMHRTLGVCVSKHVPMSIAKRAISGLIVDVARSLCTEGQWPGARLVAPRPGAEIASETDHLRRSPAPDPI